MEPCQHLPTLSLLTKTLLFTHNKKLFSQAAQASLEGAWIHETKFSLTKISLFESLKFQAPLIKDGLKLVFRLKLFFVGEPLLNFILTFLSI
jgi:hypothetical protein